MANIIEKINNQNPWFNNEDAINDDPHIKELEKISYIFSNSEFLNYEFSDGVYMATGPRQIGKTTHLKLLIKNRINKDNRFNFLYFNCDLLDQKSDIAEMVENYIKNFSKKGRKFILLDEITSVKDGILAVKYLVDSGVKSDITYILTGSSSVNIKKTGEYLPGRRGGGIDFFFLPAGFKEFLKARFPEADFNIGKDESMEKYYIRIKSGVNLAEELEKFVVCGGIPRVINDYLEKGEIPESDFALYRDWIISEIAKNKKRENISKLILKRILISVGSEVSYNSFAADTGIGSHNTVYDYLNFFIDAFIAGEIYNYDYAQKKVNFRKNKKLYLNDQFIYWLLSWWIDGKYGAYKALNDSPKEKGALAENIVYLHLSKMYKDLYFNKSSDEIDFISGNSAWECKYQNMVAPSDFKGILKFPGRKFIISKNDLKITDEYQILPLDLFLLLDKNYFEAA